MSREIDCGHPADQRWQYRDMWRCCRCGRHFWGSKQETPAVDIYGTPAFGDGTTREERALAEAAAQADVKRVRTSRSDVCAPLFLPSDPRTRYRNDPAFSNLVNTFRAVIYRCESTPSELREALLLAVCMEE